MTSGIGLDTSQLQRIAPHAYLLDGLIQRGWAVLPDYLDRDLVAGLRQEVEALHEQGVLRRAGIGRHHDFQRDFSIRRDKTHWLDGSTPIQQRYLDQMEALRQAINQKLFLGLFDFEAHFALYEPGDFYRTHLDAFRGRSNRVLSVVSYLNFDWREADGGQLNLYDPSGDQLVAQVAPHAGTLVCFLSEEVPHEVLPARSRRYSIAGWFRRNSSIGGIVDPAD